MSYHSEVYVQATMITFFFFFFKLVLKETKVTKIYKVKKFSHIFGKSTYFSPKQKVKRLTLSFGLSKVYDLLRSRHKLTLSCGKIFTTFFHFFFKQKVRTFHLVVWDKVVYATLGSKAKHQFRVLSFASGVYNNIYIREGKSSLFSHVA